MLRYLGLKSLHDVYRACTRKKTHKSFRFGSFLYQNKNKHDAPHALLVRVEDIRVDLICQSIHVRRSPRAISGFRDNAWEVANIVQHLPLFVGRAPTQKATGAVRVKVAASNLQRNSRHAYTTAGFWLASRTPMTKKMAPWSMM